MVEQELEKTRQRPTEKRKNSKAGRPERRT